MNNPNLSKDYRLRARGRRKAIRTPSEFYERKDADTAMAQLDEALSVLPE